MSDKLIHSRKLLHNSLFELYTQGGLELFQAGTHGLKPDLIIDLETSARPPISFLEHSYQSCPESDSNLNND